MRKSLIVAALVAALPVAASPRLEETPDRVLAGRQAGAPRQCLATFERDRESRTYASGDILYRGAGSTWYRNHPQGCPRFRSQMALVSVTPGQLCRGDIVRLVDPLSGFDYGSCPLGDFVPYTKPR